MNVRKYLLRPVESARVTALDPRVSDWAYELITTEEGFSARAYQDRTGRWTIGYGRTGTDVGPNMATTPEAEQAWLLRRIRSEALAVQSWNQEARLPPCCWAALISWRYNVGATAADQSSVRRYVSAAEWDQVDDALLRWIYSRSAATGQRSIDPVLQARRRAEALTWNRGLAALETQTPGMTGEAISAEDSVLNTDTVRGSSVGVAATTIGGVFSTLAPHLWNLDPRVAVALVVVLGVLVGWGIYLWRSRRP